MEQLPHEVHPDVDDGPASVACLAYDALVPRVPGDARRAAIDAAARCTWRALLRSHASIGRCAPSGASPQGVSELVTVAAAALAEVDPYDRSWATAYAAAWAEHAADVARAAAGPPWAAGAPLSLGPIAVVITCALGAAGLPEPARSFGPALNEALAAYASRVATPRGPGAPVHGAVWRRAGLWEVAARVEGWGSAPADVAPPAASREAVAWAVASGRAALDDDPEGREALERYRWGFLEVNPLVSSVFPHGTILENRLGAGEARPGEADALVDRYERNRFHYFDQPTALPFDIDTFGLIARLCAHTARPSEVRARLDRPLAWVLANVAPDGGVPVFLTRAVDAGDGRRYISTFGNACAAVQANLLLGLLALPAPRPEAASRTTWSGARTSPGMACPTSQWGAHTMTRSARRTPAWSTCWRARSPLPAR